MPKTWFEWLMLLMWIIIIPLLIFGARDEIKLISDLLNGK